MILILIEENVNMDTDIMVDQKILKTVLENKSQNTIIPLDDLVNIEDLILTIDMLQSKIVHYENLKKKRVNPIDNAIIDLDSRIDYMKKVILATLIAQNEKTVNFPGVGKVIKKKNPIKWVVNDNEEIIKELKTKGEYDKVVKEEIKITINKKELNKVLGDWDKSGDIPDYVDKQGGNDGVSITFEKIILQKEEVVANPFTIEDMDGIDI